MNKGFSTIYLYSTAICCSILLSCWMGFREIVINPDAICYLLSAQTIGTAGIQTAAHLCPQSRWPFYSIFIFELASHLHFSYALSAYLLNGLFSLISVAAFIAIVQSLGGSKRTLWLAAIVILFAHEFNSVRQYIIRDHGFWAFYLASLFFFLRYFRSPNWKTAWCFSGSLFIASLFRIEGVIFLLALPFASWFCFRYPLKQRALMFLTLHVPTLMVCLLGLIWLLWHASSVDHLGRVSEVIEQFQHGVT